MSLSVGSWFQLLNLKLVFADCRCVGGGREWMWGEDCLYIWWDFKGTSKVCTESWCGKYWIIMPNSGISILNLNCRAVNKKKLPLCARGRDSWTSIQGHDCDLENVIWCLTLIVGLVTHIYRQLLLQHQEGFKTWWRKVFAHWIKCLIWFVSILSSWTHLLPTQTELKASVLHMDIPVQYHLQTFFTDEYLTLVLHEGFQVLDEADRMLDLGFEPAIRAIISKTSKSKLHFSQQDTRNIVHKCLHQVTSRKCQVTQKPVDLVISMFCYKYLCVP